MHDAGEEVVTMAAVAARAGVTERTVYRHFESRDALLKIVWEALAKALVWPETVDGLIDSPRRRFPHWDKSPQFIRSIVYSRAALDARKSAVRERRATFACVSGAMPLMDEATARRRAAIVELLSSPYAWEVLGQLWEFDGSEAAEAASEAIEVLLGRRAAHL